MKKVIRSRVYDTETAQLKGHRYEGQFGDPAGYSEELYETEDGYYFMKTGGGEDSPYPREAIKQISADNAAKWMESYGETATA